jgi:hypothetical protein
MRVLLDNNVNQDFALLISGHEIKHAREMGWAELENGDLIAAAEGAGFAVIITADKRMQYQQTITRRRIGILVLNSRFIRWDFIAALAPQVQEILDDGVERGTFHIIHPETTA